MVGISCMHALEYDRVLATAREIRRVSPDAFILVGGHAAAAFPGPLQAPEVDAICVDDGEEVVPAVADALAAGPAAGRSARASPPGRRPLDRDRPPRRPDRPRPRAHARPGSRRARPQPVPLPPLQARLARRDGAGMPVSLQLLLGLAALRPLVPRTLDRSGRGRSRVGRRFGLHRRRPLLESPRAEPRARPGPQGARRPEALDPRPDPDGSRVPQRRAPRGLAPDREGLRHLLRPRGCLGLRTGGCRERHGGRCLDRGRADLPFDGLRRDRQLPRRSGLGRGAVFASSGTSSRSTVSSARATRS